MSEAELARQRMYREREAAAEQRKELDLNKQRVADLLAENHQLTAQRDALAAALRPFAQIAENHLSSEDDGERLWIEGDWWSSDDLTAGHFRAALALVAADTAGEG